jgi:hypothetical protein
MSKFKPQYLLDEQMLFSDAKTALAHQIREELKETNRLLRKLVEQNQSAEDEAPTEPSEPVNAESETKPAVSDIADVDQAPSEPPETPKETPKKKK